MFRNSSQKPKETTRMMMRCVRVNECVYVFVYVIYEDINLYNGMQITLVLQ